MKFSIRAATSSARASALALLLLASATQATEDTTPATPSPEAVTAVTMCYVECFREYTSHAILHHVKGGASDTTDCREMRNALAGVRRCESACNEIWTAHGRPPSKVRTSLDSLLDADETRYSGKSSCHDWEPLTEGLRIVED